MSAESLAKSSEQTLPALSKPDDKADQETSTQELDRDVDELLNEVCPTD